MGRFLQGASVNLLSGGLAGSPLTAMRYVTQVVTELELLSELCGLFSAAFAVKCFCSEYCFKLFPDTARVT